MSFYRFFIFDNFFVITKCQFFFSLKTIFLSKSYIYVLNVDNTPQKTLLSGLKLYVMLNNECYFKLLGRFEGRI